MKYSASIFIKKVFNKYLMRHICYNCNVTKKTIYIIIDEKDPPISKRFQ